MIQKVERARSLGNYERRGKILAWTVVACLGLLTLFACRNSESVSPVVQTGHSEGKNTQSPMQNLPIEELGLGPMAGLGNTVRMTFNVMSCIDMDNSGECNPQQDQMVGPVKIVFGYFGEEDQDHYPNEYRRLLPAEGMGRYLVPYPESMAALLGVMQAEVPTGVKQNGGEIVACKPEMKSKSHDENKDGRYDRVDTTIFWLQCWQMEIEPPEAPVLPNT